MADEFDTNDPRVAKLRSMFNFFANEREAERAREAAEKAEADKKKKKDEPGFFDFLEDIFPGSK